MNSLFEPHSIAVIGASKNPGKIGYKIVENIVKGGYKGKVYPVNPKGGTLLDLPIHADLKDINDEVDVAIITIPADSVYEAVCACAEKKVKYCIIISSGFAEVGNREEEEKIVAVARKHGMRILGPNVFGIYVSKSQLNATFGPQNIHPGTIAIVTQSGALGIAMIGKSASDNIGISSVISVGNKADIDEAWILDYLKDDETTRVILMYVEGFKNGEKFIESLKRVSPKKHIVTIKAGKSKRGAIAAASHTGSLAGSDNVFEGIATQLGILRAENIREAFEKSRFLAESIFPTGENTVVITNGGGIGVMCADACESYGVKLFSDMNMLKDIFEDVVPDFGSYRNPVDLTGQATVEDYQKALEKALDSEAVHSVIALYCETAVFTQQDIVTLVKEYSEMFKKKKPIVFSLFGGEKIDKATAQLQAEGIKSFDEVYDAVASMGALYKRYRFMQTEREEPDNSLENEKAIRKIIQDAKKEKRNVLLPHEAKELLKLVGIEIPNYRVARNLNEAVMYAEEIGYPVAMKIVSEDIIHKTEAGGVALDLEDAEEVMNAYQAIVKNAAAHFPDARIRGVEISQMLAKGVETIVGGTQEPTFGPVVMFGLGGIYVEAFGDVTFRAAPVSQKDARQMIEETASSSILHGVRGEKRRDMEKIAETIVKLGKLISRVRELRDVEINPLMVYGYGEGVKAVDVRILLRDIK